MEIIQLHLKHFGRFTDYRLDMHAGINIISGGNETGKSTLHAFIRAMLYGITRNRSRSLDEYQLREPWENPSWFAGSMKLLYKGKIYRIDRNFSRREESVEVVCETDGTKAEDPYAAIRYFVGGLAEEDFDNTVYIRQAQAASGARLGERLRNCMVNMEHTADTSLDVSAAQEYLKKKKKGLEKEKREALEEIERRIREMTQESAYVNRDMERLLEKRLDENARKEEPLSFERVGDVQTDAGPKAGQADQENGQGPETPEPSGHGRTGDAEAAGQAHAQDAEAAGQGHAQDAEAAGQMESGRAQSAESSGHAKSGSAAGEQKVDTEDPAESAEPEEREETDGVLLPAAVFLSFITAVLMIVCAVITTDHRMRYAAVAGAVLVGIVAFSLLWRILHPVSGEERIRRRLKREAFLNRHLGFREDPDDPADREEAMRREQRARDQILRAREEEARKEQLREKLRRARIEKELALREKEDTEQRGRDVERIARAQVLDREISLRRQKLDELKEELEGLYRKKAALASYDDEISAIEMALSRIRELSGSIYHESGAGFEKEVSALLSGLTDGHYTRIALDDKNVVMLNTPDRLLTLEQVSYGTMQQVYFALRLAAAGFLSGDSEVPIILDEPFAMYDEKRLESALRILSGSARQVILFTCQSRELDMLSNMGLA